MKIYKGITILEELTVIMYWSLSLFAPPFAQVNPEANVNPYAVARIIKMYRGNWVFHFIKNSPENNNDLW